MPHPDDNTAHGLLLPVGTQVVTRITLHSEAAGHHPAGAVGVVVSQPVSPNHRYRVRFADGSEAALRRDDLTIRKHVHRDDMAAAGIAGADDDDLWQHVIYRCVVGSRAYGLQHNDSDTDRRGIYLPPAGRHWSLVEVPGQLQNDATQECYWELRKFLLLALKANPGVLECLYTPLVEFADEAAQELREMRGAFLSRLAYQTYNGYVLGQFKKLEGDMRRHQRDPSCEPIKWKHAMHLIRLLLSGIAVMQHGEVELRVDEHRERLLAIRRGEVPWPDVDAWRLDLHREFDLAYENSTLPDRPDYDRADAFLRRVRRAAADRAVASHPKRLPKNPREGASAVAVAPAASTDLSADELSALGTVCDAQPWPLVFATVSGAHLYGFASPDSDWDLRGVHLLPPERALQLEPQPLTIEHDGGTAAGRPMDLVTHDAAKFAGMLLRKNGYVLEQLFSPWVVRTGRAHDELRALAARCLTRHHAHHYRGFAANQWKLVIGAANGPLLKPLLYTYRVLLTGIHLMRSGDVLAHLPTLLSVMRANAGGGRADLPPDIDDLIAAKVHGHEKITLADVPGASPLSVHDACRQRLSGRLEAAMQATHLPDAPSARRDLDEWLVRWRLAGRQS